MTNKSYTNDSRRGRCPQELSFLKACRDIIIESNSTNEYNAFVIIDEPIITDKYKDHKFRQQFLEESHSQEAHSNETRADYDENTFRKNYAEFGP